jgi:hypothetical protein
MQLLSAISYIFRLYFIALRCCFSKLRIAQARWAILPEFIKKIILDTSF